MTLNQPCGPDRTIFHQANILAGARRIDLGKSTLALVVLRKDIYLDNFPFIFAMFAVLDLIFTV